ncbi:serine/threonine-protein kinase [Actinomadura rifamycini]|uniref:serine/threonine-protein kinase n=1 Tax=Actinomadura rifamycini TaxID=31962 RepID=UPI001FE0D8F6|nr:serine/threonine-protein kinase [Actinomadura rifamycini]
MSWDGEGVLAGRYRRLDRIGRGGMGSVWRAHDTDLDREVAVKELWVPEQVGEQERAVWYARMEREARAAARLRHPGIVTVYDRVRGDDGRPWIVMELVRGRSLDRVLADDGALPARRAAEIGLAMLDALTAAHAKGVVHRDVKPANVLLEGERVLLTDFGIAAVEGDATLTRTGAILGTPAYMSPEQVEGGDVAPASDLWSLGATLYAAVEGRPPFTAPTHGALFVAIATRAPDPPRCGGPLARALDGLLSKNPADRPSAARVRELLGAAAARTGRPSGEAATRVDPSPVPPVVAPRTVPSGAPARGPSAGERPGAAPRDIPGGARSPGPSAGERPSPARESDRGHPVAVRGALVCVWITVALSLLIPWEAKDQIQGWELVNPPALLLILVVSTFLSAGLWTMVHRPGRVLGVVALINVALVASILKHPLFRDLVMPYHGMVISWLTGTVALMFAFAGLNRSSFGEAVAGGPSPPWMRTAVIVEGIVAVTWPQIFCWFMEIDVYMGGLPYPDWIPGVLLGIVFLAWIATQLIPRGAWIGTQLGR